VHHILQYQSLSGGKLQLHVSDSNNFSGVRIYQQHLLIFNSGVCLEHSTIKADMARGANVHPPSIISANHIDFSHHGGVRLLFTCQVSLSRSVRSVPTLACHMTWLSAIVAIEQLSRVIIWWLLILGLLGVPILIPIEILIHKAVLILTCQPLQISF
jgi:hypothetical protein